MFTFICFLIALLAYHFSKERDGGLADLAHVASFFFGVTAIGSFVLE